MNIGSKMMLRKTPKSVAYMARFVSPSLLSIDVPMFVMTMKMPPAIKMFV